MGATNLARELLEDARSVDYDTLTPDGDRRRAAGQGRRRRGNPRPGWSRRRGIEFTVDAERLHLRRPEGQRRRHAARQRLHAAGARARGGRHARPRDPARRLPPRDASTLAWNTGHRHRTLTQVSLINNPSGGLGPRITKFDPPTRRRRRPARSAAATTATFPTTTTTAGSVRWNSDGTPNGSGDSTGGPTTWGTTWQLGTAAAGEDPTDANWATTQYTRPPVLDGTYTVTAQAVRRPRHRRRLARGGAAAQPLAADHRHGLRGRPQLQLRPDVVEFDWNPNPERDIIGYRVYDLGPDNALGTGNDTLVCSTASVRRPPAARHGAARRAPPDLRRRRARPRPTSRTPAASSRESPYAPGRQRSARPRPARPLGAARPRRDLATRKPKLTWSHPNTARGPLLPHLPRRPAARRADRYDADRDGTTTTYVDPTAPAGRHRYWVTAVGPGLNESTAVQLLRHGGRRERAAATSVASR